MQDTHQQQAAAAYAKEETPADPAALQLTINGKPYFHSGDLQLPLLWFLRDNLRLTGSKYACDNGECGACTVLSDGKAVRACQLPMVDAAGHDITTIEGLQTTRLHPVQQAWLEQDIAQCGYCQTGQIMAAVDLLARKPNPVDTDIARIANLCRCGTYPDIRAAIRRAGEIGKVKPA